MINLYCENDDTIEDKIWKEEQINDEENLKFYIKFAEDDFNEDKKALFATMMWPGTRALCSFLAASVRCEGKSIVEFGAGVGLPSLVVSRLSPLRVVATDYPAPSVLVNLEKNMERNTITSSLANASIVRTVGYRWGDNVEPLISLNDGKLFDIAICSECLWKEDTHQALVDSLANILQRNHGKAIVGFSHHHPGREHVDLNFFQLAAQKYLIITNSQTVQVPYMWADSKTAPYYIYELVFSPP